MAMSYGEIKYQLWLPPLIHSLGKVISHNLPNPCKLSQLCAFLHVSYIVKQSVGLAHVTD